jgi:T5SS/PEP-CTERM-associated repeat protein
LDELRVLTGTPTGGANIKTYGGGSILINTVALTSSEGVYVGSWGAGSGRVESGGDIVCRFANVGADLDSVGVMEIDGIGSTWQVTQQLRVGNAGDGTLKITGGAVVTCESEGLLAVGEESYGRLLIDGNGSVWNTESNFSVGYRGGAEMTIRNGGAVYSAKGYVGLDPMADATAIIEGTGSKWECTSGLFVGSYGTGGLTVRDSGRLLSTWGSIAYTGGSEGRVTIEGNSSRWDSSESIFVGGGINGAGGQGRLEVNPGAEAHAQKELTLFPGGTIAIGLNGTAAGKYGQIIADEIATFDGTLEIHVAAGAALTRGESMDIITYSQTATTFADVRIFGSAPDSFEWEYGEGALELTYVPEPVTLFLMVGCLALLPKRKRMS